MSNQTNQYKNLEELSSTIKHLNLNIGLTNGLESFRNSVSIRNFIAPNSIAIHLDKSSIQTIDGSTDDIIAKQYKRFAKSGAGLICSEPVSVNATDSLLYITQENIKTFKKITSTIKHVNDSHCTPLCLMQLTDCSDLKLSSYKPSTFIMQTAPYLNQNTFIPLSCPNITDQALEKLEDNYVKAALLAKEAGFDGVDICSNGTLSSELLCAYRRGGSYGGSFENRTRFLCNLISKIRAAVGFDFIIGCNLNIYNGLSHGFGVDKRDYRSCDLTEPIRLIGLLRALGLDILSITMDQNSKEHSLKNDERLLNACEAIQHTFPDLPIISKTSHSLGHLAPHVGAATLNNKASTFINFDSRILNFPKFIKDILTGDSVAPTT